MVNSKNNENWEKLSLLDVAERKKFAIVDGPFGTQLHADEYVDEGTPLVRVTNLSYEGSFKKNDLKFISAIKANRLERSKVLPRDIIIAKTGATIGKTAIFPQDYENGIIASSCLKISFNKNRFSPEFFMYLLVSPRGQKSIIDGAGGSTRTTINIKPFANISFFVPKSLSEQQLIAEILLTVDKAITNTECLIEKHNSIKQGLMQDLFRYGIDEKGQIRSEKTHTFKDSPLGRIPKEWEISKFSDLIKHITNKFNPLGKPSKRCINLENIEQGTGHLVDISDSKSNSSIKTLFIKNDILFGKLRPYLKKYYFAEFEGVCSTEILVLRVLDQNNSMFFYYLISSNEFINYVDARTFGTKMPRTDWKIIKDYDVRTPPVKEQEHIALVLNQIYATTRTEIVYKEKLLALKQALMSELLCGKVRVNKLLH